MIRINLLKGRAGSNDSLPPALDASGAPSRFLTKREIVLALALVAIGCGIIAAQVLGVFREPLSDDEPLVAIYERPAAPTPPPAVAGEPPAVAAVPIVPSEPPIAAAPVQSETSIVTAEPPVQERPEREFGAAPTHTVAALKLVPWGQAIEILAEVQGQPQYRSFWLTNPDRLVIDVEDAELRVSPSELSRASPHPLIRQLRAAQNSFEPARVRIVVETVRDGPVEITANGVGISVKISPAP
ncbi:MAG: AMIN domain-containing protein [Acidobacteria bacterium]|nr:AMIN domain-containing protein [Acidobacteriota bacterium]MDA1233962.1 AMIN domain-containing protein [Acidobacteriota bacterium]